MDFAVLLKRRISKRKQKELNFMPEISLIIPVYNSADSLERCIQSVYQSEYDLEKIYVMLVDNGSRDNSYEIYCQCREKFPELAMVWETSAQGKSKALNKALYNSSGKYIIHIDSDGILHPQALKNMVTLFENELDIHCVTGTIMTNPQMIDETKGFFKRQFRKAIEDLDRLYIQRQRWQRGEMEVIHMFNKDMKAVKGFASNFVIRLLMYDHTFAFPRMIWYFALICLTMFNYPVRLVVMSLGIIYGLYVLDSFLFYISISLFLSKYKDLQRYYMRKWYHILFQPMFNFITFWFRFAGIINSIKGEQSWKARTFREEKQAFFKVLKKDFSWFFVGLEKLRKAVNISEESME